jgi:tRNA(Ile)-lysidine synthase
MLKEFQQYNDREKVFMPQDRILLAVSGGIDSVAMADLFSRSKNKCAIIHCNFQLRGKESDEDEKFTQALAAMYDMPFFCKKFDTPGFSRHHKISIQQAARELRYNWFEEVRHGKGYQLIATAHHKDDNLETFFINLVRGTGVKGLAGIKTRQGCVIRPLLFCGRKEIEVYIKENKLDFREDSSNKETKYLRNKIRHNILPLFEEVNPSFRQTMEENIHRFGEASDIFAAALAEIKKEMVSAIGNATYISIKQLNRYSFKSSILYEILKEYGFSSGIIEDVVRSLHSESGKQFISDHFRLVRDRESLIITPEAVQDDNRYYIELPAIEIEKPVHLIFKTEKAESFKIPRNPLIAVLDIDKIEFPLYLRRWQNGDYFMPFGMNGMKKVSDFLIDHKVSIPEKENTWVLMSGERLIWLVGYRIDDRYKVTKNTREILCIEIKK